MAQGATEERIDQVEHAVAGGVPEPGRPYPYGVLRKTPEQDRSWKKVEAVLDAGDRMLAKAGYQAVVSDPAELCKQARITMGTFYTYFANTQAVLEALRLRWLESAYPLADDRLAGPFEHWEQVADAIVDWFLDFYERPPVRALWFGHALTPVSADAVRETHLYLGRTMAARIRALGVDYRGEEPDEMIAVELVDSLTRFAYRESRAGRPKRAFVKSVRRAAQAYIGTLVAPTDDPHQ